ncbi:hypothetical protein P7K49_000761, partial [Saguinus oedipus]
NVESPRWERHGMPAQPARVAGSAGATAQWHPAQNSLVWVPCKTSNLRFGMADWHVHLIERDLDNEPDQEIPGKRDLRK